MAKRLNPRYRSRRYCPYCGGPVYEVSETVCTTNGTYLGPADKAAASFSGDKGDAEQMWTHFYRFVCDPCVTMYTFDQTKPKPGLDAVFPEDYYLTDHSDNAHERATEPF